MSQPVVRISDELKSFMASKKATAIAIDIIDCVNWGRHISEVFAYTPKGMLLKRLADKAATILECDGIQVLLTTPALICDDEVLFEYNGNRHLGDIDVAGIHL